MANRDFDIDFRFRADSTQAERAFKNAEQGIERMQRAVRDANAEMAGGVGGGDAGAAAEATAQQAVGDALERNARMYREMAQASKLTQQASSAISGRTDLDERLARSASSMDDLADTEARLDASMAAGMLTAEEYEAGLAHLNTEQERLSKEADRSGKALDSSVARYDKAGVALERLARDEARLKEAVDAGRISREQYDRAMQGIGAERAKLEAVRAGADNTAGAMKRLGLATAGAQRDLTQFLIYSTRGDWQLAGNQILQMGTRANLAGALFSGAGLAIAGVVAVVGGLTAAVVAGYLQMRAFDAALISTGNSAGVSSGQLAEMRNQIGDATGDYADAQKALVALAGSGKLSGDALEAAAQAAVNLSTLTGQSIEQTTSEILRLADAPLDGLLKLNDQYHFLTVEVYEQVKSLQEQGREQDAVKVGMDALARTSQQRTEELAAHAGSVERAWKYVRETLHAALQDLKDIGRTDIDAQMRRLSDRMMDLQEKRDGTVLGRDLYSSAEKAAWDRQIAQVQAQYNALYQQRAALEAQQSDAAAARTAERDGIDAAEAVQRTLDRGRTKAEQYRDALRELNAEFLKMWNSGKDMDKLVDVTRDANGDFHGGAYDQARRILEQERDGRGGGGGGRARRAGGKSDAQRAEEDARREIENLTRQIGLLDALGEGETKVSEAARVRYEIENGAYKSASAGTQARLQEVAQSLDQERHRRDIAEELKSIDLATLRLQGEDAAAALQETLDKYERLKAELTADGRTDDANRVERAIDLTLNHAQLDTFAADAQRTFNDIQRETGRIQAEQQAGLITEYDAQQRIVALYRDKNAVLTQMLPTMEAIAATMGPEAQAQVARIRDELERMAQTTSLLQQQIGSTFQGTFSNALTGLITNTMSLRDAVRSFFADMASGLARMASQALAQAAWAKILKLFGKGSGDIGEGADKLTSAAAATTVAGMTIYGAAAALLAAATAAGGSGGGSGGGAGGAAGGIFGAIASGIVSAFGYATGGYVSGPGTGTSDSILARLSDGEHVTRAAVVKQPGALAFLTDFNNRGMDAVEAWQRRFEGVAMPRLPSFPSVPKFNFADGGLARAAASAGMKNDMSIYLVQDRDALAAKLASHPAMRKAIVAEVSENGSAIRASWGG